MRLLQKQVKTNDAIMERLRIEYQKMIDQTSRFYATLYLALIAFFSTHVIPFTKTSPALLMVTGILLMVVAASWRWKIDSWNQLLEADIRYNKTKLKGYREYADFIHEELENAKIIKKKKGVLYPNFSDDLLPRILLMVSFGITIMGLVLALLASTIDIVKWFR
jgi:uncharacterized membrane protein YbhN (UPF0104 family)